MESHRNFEIDRLRGVAILFVIWQHQWALFPWDLPAPPTGWMGVDLFFVISGFVVTKSLCASMDRARRPSDPKVFGAFYLRRFFRLAPAGVLWLALSTLLTLTFNRSKAFGEASALAPQILSIFCLCYNYYLASGGEGSLVWHWSLSAEEQFYLFYPLFLLAVPALTKRIKWLGVTIVASMFLLRPMLYAVLSAHHVPDWPSLCVPPYFRSDGILMGCLLFFAVTQYESAQTWFEPLFKRLVLCRTLALGLLLLLFFCHAIIGPGHLSLSLPIVALTSTGLVFLAQANRGIFSFKKSLPSLDWIGKRSYVLYLCHVPIFRLNRELWFRSPWNSLLENNIWMLGIYLVLTFALVGLMAELTHRFIEGPGMKWGVRLSERVLPRELSKTQLPCRLSA